MRRRAVLLVPVVSPLLGVTACTAPEPGSGRPAAAVVRAAAQDPVTLIGAAQTGLADLSGYEVTGTLRRSGTAADVDLQVGYRGGHGTVTVDGLTEVLDLGGVGLDDAAAGDPSGLFVTAPAAYWEKQGVAAADAARYDGQQVSIPRSSPLAAAASLLTVSDLAALVFGIAGDPQGASVTASPPVGGQDAWVVDFAVARDTRMEVQIAGQQFPLRFVAPGVDLAFGHFGVEPAAHTPAAVGLSLPG